MRGGFYIHFPALDKAILLRCLFSHVILRRTPSDQSIAKSTWEPPPKRSFFPMTIFRRPGPAEVPRRILYSFCSIGQGDLSPRALCVTDSSAHATRPSDLESHLRNATQTHLENQARLEGRENDLLTSICQHCTHTIRSSDL